ncbi:MAG TPA: sigma-70 family RNA polymerase sigma factor [Acidimicrobiia bacterium]|nr:sigma-70 family RNA polymerase sigma factor [Acidimicrobiia bacterium]
MSAATATPARPGGEVATDVLARARAGDRQAFTEVVRHYDHRLRALAYRLLGDRAAMDDALQEAYVKAYRALPGFREDAGLGTWLYQITYRACIDLQRRETRHRSDPAAWAPPTATATSRTDLRRALASLPVDQRAAVLLVDAEGLDYDAAAAVLGVAPGTIASRLSRARAALRAALAEGDSR